MTRRLLADRKQFQPECIQIGFLAHFYRFKSDNCSEGFSSLTPHQANVPVSGHIACSSESAIGCFYLIGFLLELTSPFPLAAVYCLYLTLKVQVLDVFYASNA